VTGDSLGLAGVKFDSRLSSVFVAIGSSGLCLVEGAIWSIGSCRCLVEGAIWFETLPLAVYKIVRSNYLLFSYFFRQKKKYKQITLLVEAPHPISGFKLYLLVEQNNKN
jgi:hypothetical protein